MNEQEQALRAALITDIPPIQWMGDPVDSMPTARALLAADQQVFTDEQENKALFFYDGDQWYDAVAQARHEQGRGCPVFNRVPLLLASSLDAGMLVGDEPLQPDEITRLKIILSIRNMDAQRLFNYMCACAGEQATFNRDIATVRVGTEDPPK